ncbi:MAG: tetratricopeptide repeat protein [bacterium]|nr:tetratricopeptide repeat protein [bacterium]
MTSDVNPVHGAGSAQVLTEQDLLRLYESGRRELFVPLAEWLKRGGQPAKAIELLEEGLAEFPDRISGWVLLARVKMQMGDIRSARRHYAHILARHDSGNLPALRALGSACMEEGNLFEAENYIKRWHERDPLDPEAEDLLEELQVGAGEAVFDLSPDPAPRAVLDLNLDDIERDLMPAPSLEDRNAWEAEAQDSIRRKSVSRGA